MADFGLFDSCLENFTNVNGMIIIVGIASGVDRFVNKAFGRHLLRVKLSAYKGKTAFLIIYLAIVADYGSEGCKSELIAVSSAF